jgi:hypothetical protein
MQLQNRAVDPGRQPEVVAIDDKMSHRVSVPTGAARLGRIRANMMRRGCNRLAARVGG